MRSGKLHGYLFCALLAGCTCSRMSGEVGDVSFTRCAQIDPPPDGSFQAGSMTLTLRDRVLDIQTREELRIVAFTGPIGAPLSRADQAFIAAQKPGLVLVLGGLGDDEGSAESSLSLLEAVHVPLVFLDGGADRLPVVQKAFESLPEAARQRVIHGSGLREIRVGDDRFVLVPGSPLGRYALDDQACGFTRSDLEDLRSAAQDQKKAARTWLLSWAAPSGWGVSSGAGGTDVGSPELFAFAQALGAEGGVFAYPETQAGMAVRDDKRKGPAIAVPRLGRVGATRAQGGRVPAGLALMSVSKERGLSLLRVVDGPG